MKPTNAINAPREIWVLRDFRGEFYAYSDHRGVRCTDRIEMARKYSSRRGALVAMSNLVHAYGKSTTPIKYRITYEPA